MVPNAEQSREINESSEQGARSAPRDPKKANSMPLEILHGALVLLGRGARGKGAEIAPFACLRILLARIQPVLSGRELSDHGVFSDRNHIKKQRVWIEFGSWPNTECRSPTPA